MRGVQIAAFVLCFALAVSVMGGMGWMGHVGVSIDPGLDQEVEEVDEELESPGASSAGGDEFSIVGGALDTLNTLRVLTTQTAPALVRLHIPAQIATAVGTVVGFTMVIFIVQVIRGMRFR